MYEGLTALDRGKPDRAEELFTEASSLTPADPQIQEHLASSLAEQGELPRAIKQLEKAIQVSDEPRLHVQLAELYLQKFQPAEAEKHCRLAINRDRRDFQAWKLLGKSQFAQGQLNESLKSFHRATSYNSNDLDTQFDIARAYEALGQFDRALCVIESTRQAFPPDREPSKLVEMEGNILLALQQPERAVIRLSRLNERGKLSAEGYLTLSQAYRDTGDLSNARLTAAIAVESYPNDNRFAAFLGNLPGTTDSEIVFH